MTVTRHCRSHMCMRMRPQGTAVPLLPTGSPLMLAADSGRTEVVELLSKAGADLNSRDAFGWVRLCCL